MTEKSADTVDCPACEFTYKAQTPFGTLVRACPGCGAPTPGANPRPSPKGASRFIPRIPTGVVPQSEDDAEAATKPGTSPTVETAAAAPVAGSAMPPMPTPPPRSGPFLMPTGRGGSEVPVCFGDPEVFQKGEFCPHCGVYEKCYPRVLVITLNKMIDLRGEGSKA